MVKTCGDCIHADICKEVNGGWFSPQNPAYCKLFKNKDVLSKWISVEDELPKDKMIIDGETYYRAVAVVTDDKFAAQKIAFYDEGLMTWYQPNNIVPLRNVTHWMPLPELPKEE